MTRARRSPTVRDVAEHAGVSPKTVSNVVNDFAGVAPATRARVLAAIAALGYRRNTVAYSLRTRRSRAIGLIVPTIANSFYADLLQGVQDIADGRGYVVILGTDGRQPERMAVYIDLMLERRVDGLIMQPTRNESTALTPLLQAGVPLALTTNWDVHPACDHVGSADEAGAFDAVTHLLTLGHRRIAYLGRGPASDAGSQRWGGYIRALETHGVPVDERLIVDTSHDRAGGRWGVRRLLDQGIEFTAVFAATDLAAFGALNALRQAGRRVPDDVSLVGFDDIAEATDLEPPLTTVVNPARARGVRAAELLFERIGGYTGPARRVVLPTKLVVRASTRAPATTVPLTQVPSLERR